MARLRAVTAIAGHDLLDLRRQRGVWVGLLLIPFVTVSFLLLLPGILAEREQTNQARATYRVAVQVGSDSSASSAEAVEALRPGLPSSRFRLVASERARQDVVRSRADVGLLLDGDPAAALAGEEEQVTGSLLVLTSRSRSRAAVGALGPALERFGLSITDRRLAANDLPAATVRPFVVESVDLTDTPRGQRLNLATVLPLLVLLPLAGTVGVAAQRISGSKDQRVFEPLLVLPFTRRELLLGKALSSMAIGTITLVAVGVPLYLGRFVPLGAGGQSVVLPLRELASVLGLGVLLLVLLVLLGAAVGAASRTSAELGSILQLVTLPIFLLGSLLQFRSAIVTTPQLLVLPFFGPLLCVRDVAVGALTSRHLAVVAAASVAWGTAFVVVGVRMLESERSVLRATA
jgi:ABC-type Na+ efflux pump permease subunit